MDVEKVIDNVVARFIGTKHERDVKRIQPLVEAVNALEPEMKQLSDEELGARTLALKAEVQARLEERVTAPRRIVELERDLGARMVLSSLSQIENCLELFFHFETFIARLPGL